MKKFLLASLFSFLFVFLGAGYALAATCGDSATTGYSCMNKNDGTNCVTGLCPGGVDNQCCKQKGATTEKPQGASTDTPIPANKKLPNPLGITSINSLAARLINFVLGLVGTISLVLFVYGGFIWMISAGSQEKVRKGRDIIVWAAVGMAVVFMAYTVVRFVIEGLQGV